GGDSTGRCIGVRTALRRREFPNPTQDVGYLVQGVLVGGNPVSRAFDGSARLHDSAQRGIDLHHVATSDRILGYAVPALPGTRLFGGPNESRLVRSELLEGDVESLGVGYTHRTIRRLVDRWLSVAFLVALVHPKQPRLND